MEREEINTMEENLEYNKKDYNNSFKKLIMSIGGFSLSAGMLTLITISPLPLIAKVPLTILVCTALTICDCIRVDSNKKYNELKELKKLNTEVSNEETEENEVEKENTKKPSLFSRLFKKHKKSKEEEQLPLPQEEVENNNEDIELEPKKKKNIFKRAIQSLKQAKRNKEAPFDEEELSAVESKKAERKAERKAKRTERKAERKAKRDQRKAERIARKAERKAKKIKTETLPLPSEDEDMQIEKPIINYSFTKNGPQIAEIDLSNIHTEPGLYIEPQYFGFENDPADVKHFVVNRNDEEVNNYVAEEIENVTGVKAMYVDYNVEDEEKRVYMLTR